MVSIIDNESVDLFSPDLFWVDGSFSDEVRGSLQDVGENLPFDNVKDCDFDLTKRWAQHQRTSNIQPNCECATAAVWKIQLGLSSLARLSLVPNPFTSFWAICLNPF